MLIIKGHQYVLHYGDIKNKQAHSPAWTIEDIAKSMNISRNTLLSAIKRGGVSVPKPTMIKNRKRYYIKNDVVKWFLENYK